MFRYLIVLALVPYLPLAAWADIIGQPRVIDGDTLEIAGQRIRLHGIDAPESKQLCRRNGERWRCGKDATSALKAFLGSRPVSCEELDRDRYRRIVAKCTVGRIDIGRWMVSEGWAMAYRRYSTDYVSNEAKARTARRGIWRGDFMPPWDWRKIVRDARRSRHLPQRQLAHRAAWGGRADLRGPTGRQVP